MEMGHIYSDTTYTGDGLANALNAALGNSDVENIKTVYSSMNGESFFAKEYGVVITRNNNYINDEFTLEQKGTIKISARDICSGSRIENADVTVEGEKSKQTQVARRYFLECRQVLKI